MGIKIEPKSYWDMGQNLSSKPYITNRTTAAVAYIMEELELPIGKALEKLIKEDLYDEIIEKLKEDYPDIEE